MLPYHIPIWVRFLKTDPGGWNRQQSINTSNIANQQADWETGQENSLSEHLDLLQQASRGKKGFCTPSLQPSKPGLCPVPTQREQQPGTGLICCGSPIPGQPEGWVPTIVSRSGLQAPLGLPVSSPRVSLGWPEHPRCLLWTRVAKPYLGYQPPAQARSLTAALWGHRCPPSHLGTPEGLCRSQSDRHRCAFSQLSNPFNLHWLRKGLPTAGEAPAQGVSRPVSVL